MKPQSRQNEATLLEKIRLQAVAQVEDKKRKGLWAGSIVAHTEYQKRPLDWIVTHLGVPENTIRWSLNENYRQHSWDGDPDPLVRALEALAEGRDVGIESGTGVGKSFACACITYWFIAAFEDSIVVTVAPKEAQLLRQIWKEMGKLWPRFHRHFPQAELLAGSLRMKPKSEEKEVWSAYAFVCGVGASEESATKAQGIHAEHLLIITEETPGIHHAIMTALVQTRTDSHNIQVSVGNPDHQQDELHKFCMRKQVVNLRASALDHPNIVTGEPVVPGTVGPDRLRERIEELGVGSRLYNSRIRGISPPEAEDALIRREWCEAAAARYNDDELRQGVQALGADVADSPEGDAAALAYWQGACLTHVDSWRIKVDANEVAARIFREIMSDEYPVDPRYIGIDSVGVGASVVNELRRLGIKIRHVSGGKKAIPALDKDALWSVTEPDLGGNMKAAGPKVIEAEEYNNLRSQVWWKMRNDLRLGRVALPRDDALFEDLCTPTYKTQNGKICVETKEEIVKRLRRSPDKGDACAYGNFIRPRVPNKRKATKDELAAAGHVFESPNRDTRLERMLARSEKKARREEQRLRRMYSGRGS